MPKKPLIQKHEDWRNFDYEQGGTTLKFNLRIDNKNQLRNFKELLEKALADVTAEIERDTRGNS